MNLCNEILPNSVMSNPFSSSSYGVLCCLCGVCIEPNPSAMCAKCLSEEVDITSDINKNILLLHCRQCNRYLLHKWILCELESREMLALCLKKIRGLNKISLIDANFVYTEPHSRRIKVKLTVQKEVVNGAILQQSIIVTFIIENSQCDDCKRVYTPHSWNAKLQLRQKYPHHKHAIFLIEQIIIKHNMQNNILRCVDVSEGLDIHMSSKQDAQRLNDFLCNFFPIKSKHSKQLISHDTHNNTYFHKYTIASEIAPVGVLDVVYISEKLSNIYGGVNRLLLCTKINKSIYLLNFLDFEIIQIPNETYWKSPFQTMYSRNNLSEFLVLNLEKLNPQDCRTNKNSKNFVFNKQYQYCEVELSCLKDLIDSNKRYFVRSWIPANIKIGDFVMGYDINKINVNFGDESLSAYIDNDLPVDVIVVRKMYPKPRRRRAWKLKFLQIEFDEASNAFQTKNRSKKTRDEELEDFKNELELDVDLRSDVQIFKDPKFREVESMHKEEEEEDTPYIRMTEMMESMTLEDNQF